MGVVGWMLIVLAGYASIGVVAGAAFVFRGVGKVDPAAAHASIPVRLLLLPGAAALWPLMLAKWRRAGAGS